MTTTPISTRQSVLGLKVETTEGTPVMPAAATDFIALHDDFDISPEFDNLENAEIHGSIGKAKTIRGAENPKASVPIYLRHSGVEGTAPNYGNLLKAAFGASSTQSTERATVSSSTTALLKVNTGIGADYERGELVLVKDGTNGYSIRPVHSISGDDLTLGFSLANAPASGVNLGKCVLYKPADTGHQSLTLSYYLGNAGALEVMAGGRVTELGLEFSAGALIKGSCAMEGLAFFYNPIEITSSTKYLDFTDDDGTFAAIIPTGWYKDPSDLADAIKTAMDTANAGETHTCTYSSSTGKFTIKSTGTLLTLKFATGTNTANTIATKIGFTVADKSGTAATTGYTSTSALTFNASYTPTYDSADPIAAKYHEVLIGDSTDTTAFDASSVKFTLSLDRKVIPSVCAQSGRVGSVIAGRTAKVSVTALIGQYDVDKFARYRAGTDTRFFYAFGTKAGSNWVAGKCGGLYLPTASVSQFAIKNADGLATLEMELTSYVDASGNGEVYLGFV